MPQALVEGYLQPAQHDGDEPIHRRSRDEVEHLARARLAGQVALRPQRADDLVQDQEGAVAFDAAVVDAEDAQALGCGEGAAAMARPGTFDLAGLMKGYSVR